MSMYKVSKPDPALKFAPSGAGTLRKRRTPWLHFRSFSAT